MLYTYHSCQPPVLTVSTHPLSHPGAAVPSLGSHIHIIQVSGQQQVSKGRQGPDASNAVHVLLAIVRLAEHATDLVVSLNTPMYISPSSAAAEHAGAGAKGAHMVAHDLFGRILQTLEIKDYGLFGSG